MKVLIKTKDEELTLNFNEIVQYAQYQALIKGLMTIITTENAAIEFLKSIGIEVCLWIAE